MAADAANNILFQRRSTRTSRIRQTTASATNNTSFCVQRTSRRTPQQRSVWTERTRQIAFPHWGHRYVRSEAIRIVRCRSRISHLWTLIRRFPFEASIASDTPQ